MPFAPYQWRAGKGYLPPPDAVPVPLNMAAFYAYPYGVQAQPQYAHQIAYAPGAIGVQAVIAAEPAPAKKKSKKAESAPPSPPPAPSEASSAPKTLCKGKGWKVVGKGDKDKTYTITVPPPPPKSCPRKKIKITVPPPPPASAPKKIKIRIPPPPPCSTICPSDSISSHSSGSGNSSGSSSKKTEITVCSKAPSGLKLRGGGGEDSTVAASSAPPATKVGGCPTLAPGVNYMFPSKKSHTKLHVFNKCSPVWEDKYKGKQLAFKIFKVSTGFSVRNVIERVLGKGEGDKEGCGKWVATECHEVGEGAWKKGTTIPYSDDKAAGSLASMGWDQKRGNQRPPVWLVVHKA
ncbi:hypothetical protein CBER1_06205 [Cercospora berteroae]|uniref:Uncharacterized protein n=1 Tax=Cercospora berteroae TaxID=357750 RepID=A0A2S6CMK4_9PEZI|nr:hypothetical protein CBER1_06205 [Cercospora berteroae]